MAGFFWTATRTNRIGRVPRNLQGSRQSTGINLGVDGSTLSGCRLADRSPGPGLSGEEDHSAIRYSRTS